MSHQDRALELLLTGKTTLETARLVGVDERTIRRWKKTPAFAEELRELRQEVHDEIMLRVAALIEKLQTAAFAQLEWLKAMADKLPSLSDKLRCMNAISQLNFKWSKFIMDRQDRIEQRTLTAFAKLAQKADKNGQVYLGATGAPTAPIPKDGSVHPCPDDSPTQKPDANGHSAPLDPELQALKAHRAYRERLAAKSAQKADINGRASATSVTK